MRGGGAGGALGMGQAERVGVSGPLLWRKAGVGLVSRRGCGGEGPSAVGGPVGLWLGKEPALWGQGLF